MIFKLIQFVSILDLVQNFTRKAGSETPSAQIYPDKYLRQRLRPQPEVQVQSTYQRKFITNGNLFMTVSWTLYYIVEITNLRKLTDLDLRKLYWICFSNQTAIILVNWLILFDYYMAHYQTVINVLSMSMFQSLRSDTATSHPLDFVYNVDENFAYDYDYM